MSSIDERVVEMRFNNKQFEGGVKETLSTLDRLKQGLRLDGARKGLEDVSATANKLSLAGLAQSVDGIASRFSAMSVVAITALSNIVNKAVDAGLQLAKSLTIAPINQGFQEYELKLGSIQTIMAGSGEALSVVNSKLDELNTYADKTIYSFADMTTNIGKFTNAGVDLDTAVASIQGVANVAAVSGANANEASRAMYNFAQALSKGYVQLIDWKSIELANMGTAEFKQQLIDAAVAAGTLTDAGDGLYKTLEGTAVSATKNFNESLTDQWLTTQVLNETLGDYADETTEIGKKAFAAAQDVKTFTQLIDTMQEAVGSGWAQTFEILIGDFDEAKALWTNVNDVFSTMVGNSAESRNNLLQGWKNFGGRDMALEGIANLFNALLSVINPIKDAFRDIFPPMTVARLHSMTEAFLTFTERLKMGDETSKNLRRTFAGLFAILGIGWEIVKQVAKTLFDVVGVASEGTGGFLEFTAKIGDFLVKLHEAVKTGEGLSTVFGFIGTVLKTVIRGIQNFASFIGSMFSGVDLDGVSGSFDGIKKRLDGLAGPAEKVGEVLSWMGQNFLDFVRSLGGNTDSIGDFFSGIGGAIADAMKNIDFNLLLDGINTGLFAGLVLMLKKFLGGFGDEAEGGEGIMDKLKGSIDGLTDTFNQMQNTLRAATLLTLALAIGVITASIVALAGIDSAALTKSLIAISVMFGQLFTAMMIMEKIAGTSKGWAKMPVIAAALILLAVAIRILASSVKALSGLSWEELSKGLLGVAALLAVVVLAARGLEGSAKGMIRAGAGILILAIAIKILASAVTDLSGLSWEEMAKGLISVGVLLGALTLFTKFGEANKGAISQGVGLLLLAAAMKVLASATKDFASMDVGSLVKGIGAVTALLAVFAIFTRVVGDPKRIMATSASLVVIGVAMKILASAMQDFATMSWEEIGKGLVSMAGALLLIVVALNAMPPTTLASAASLVIVAGALMILADVMQKMAGFSWEEIAKSLVLLAGALLIIGLAMYGMTAALPGAAALLVVAAALAVLVPVLQAFGQMSWGEIVKGLLMLAGVFVVLGLAGLILTPLIPVILGLGIAIGLIGIAVLAAGVGLLLFATALTILSVAGAGATAVLVAMVSSLAGLIPVVMQKIGEGIIALAMVIATSGPAITMALTTVLMSLISAIETLTPKIVTTLFKLVLHLLRTMEEAVPEMVRSGMNMLEGILQGIADNIGDVVDVAADIIVNFVNGIADNLPDIIESGTNLIISFVEGLAASIRNNQERMRSAGKELASAIISGMTGGLTDGISTVARKAREVASAAWEAAKSFLKSNSPSKRFIELGKDSDRGLAIGFEAYSGLVSKASRGVAEEALDSLRKSISGLGDIVSGEVDMRPVVSPVLDLTDVQRDAKGIGSIFGTPTLSTSKAYSDANNISALAEEVIERRQELANMTGDVRILEYKQYNTSPEALSDREIYRNTNNQLSTVKEALGI